MANHIEQITTVFAQASDVVHMEYESLNLARARILYLRQHLCLLTICPEVEQLFGTLFNMIFAIVFHKVIFALHRYSIWTQMPDAGLSYDPECFQPPNHQSS